MTGSKPDIFHTPLLTPFASRLIHICVDLREIRTSDAHPKIPQNPCGRRDTEACTHLRGQPQNPREGRAACINPRRRYKCNAKEGRYPVGIGPLFQLSLYPPLAGTHGRHVKAPRSDAPGCFVLVVCEILLHALGHSHGGSHGHTVPQAASRPGTPFYFTCAGRVNRPLRQGFASRQTACTRLWREPTVGM